MDIWVIFRDSLPSKIRGQGRMVPDGNSFPRVLGKGRQQTPSSDAGAASPIIDFGRGGLPSASKQFANNGVPLPTDASGEGQVIMGQIFFVPPIGTFDRRGLQKQRTQSLEPIPINVFPGEIRHDSLTRGDSDRIYRINWIVFLTMVQSQLEPICRPIKMQASAARPAPTPCHFASGLIR